MRTLGSLAGLSVLATLVVGLVTRAAEQKVALDKLPKPVLETVKTRFPDAQLVAGSREEENGKTFYEVTLRDQGHNIDVLLTSEGKIDIIEKTISVKELPKPVTRAIEGKYPRAMIKRIEALIKDDKVTAYEALLVTPDKKTLEIKFDPQGKLVNEETKKPTEQEKE